MVLLYINSVINLKLITTKAINEIKFAPNIKIIAMYSNNNILSICVSRKITKTQSFSLFSKASLGNQLFSHVNLNASGS